VNGALKRRDERVKGKGKEKEGRGEEKREW